MDVNCRIEVMFMLSIRVSNPGSEDGIFIRTTHPYLGFLIKCIYVCPQAYRTGNKRQLTFLVVDRSF